MRCYHLCNMYLSSIQQGVQSAHAQMELFVKYQEDSTKKSILFDWAENHKTMIVLNGGFLSDMKESINFFRENDNPNPFAVFHESEEALGGILTNIAIVLPEKIYKTSELIRKKLLDENLNSNHCLNIVDEVNLKKTMDSFGKFSEFEIELCSFMNNFRLAN